MSSSPGGADAKDLTADQVLSEIRRIIMPSTDATVAAIIRQLTQLRNVKEDLESELVAANEATEHKSALVHLRDREIFDARRDLKIANEMNDRLSRKLQQLRIDIGDLDPT